MNYRLAVLTHGAGPYLTRALASFRTHVQPLPADAVLYADGMDAINHARAAIVGYDEWPWSMGGMPEPEGFCEGTRALWREAAKMSPESLLLEPRFVFWLEHDFTFDRGVNLNRLAEVLDAHPDLAQMSLMRQAVSQEEIEAGGLYESRADEFDDRGDWLEHRSYFTTNPSLIPTPLMLERMPPPGPECEGRFGIELVEDGLSFGVWGDGSPWVRHFGIRTGFDY